MQDALGGMSEYGDSPSVYSSASFSPAPDTRMSYLGPKMRVHSRAPWEMDDDPLPRPSTESARGGLYALAQETLSTHIFSVPRQRSDPPPSPAPRTRSDSAPRPRAHSPPSTSHPYANPDLVVSYGNESTDSIACTLTPDSSHNSIPSRPTRLSTKAISSPVARDPPLAPLPGWAERNPSPGFSLISLEEARAQRMHSSSRLSSATSDSAPFPDHDTSPSDSSPSSRASFASRARGRSISAGAAKAKSAIQNIVGQPKLDRRDSDIEPDPAYSHPPGKSLKHKKSGFMRLFNKDQDDPPPVPSLPDIPPPFQPLPRPPRPNVQRIPVPSLSPSLADLANPPSRLDFPQNNPEPWNRRSPTSPKRTPPPALTINTVAHSASNPRSSASAIGDGLSHLGVPLDRPWTNAQPQSAPANVTEFPALKLRPVSTLFSAQFADHMLSESRTSGETTDSDTPRSPSPTALISPVTPNSFSRPSTDQTRIVSGHDESAFRALQNQMAAAKKAWEKQVQDLQSQVRGLQIELDELRSQNNDYCSTCGRGAADGSAYMSGIQAPFNASRTRTATTSRFANALT